MGYQLLLIVFIFFLGIIQNGECLSRRAANESANTLIFTTIQEDPFIMEVVGERDGDGDPKYEGFLVDMWEKINKEMGNKYKSKFVLVKDSFYGATNPDGTWNGMVGEIIRAEADVAFAPLTVTGARQAVIDFSKPYWNVISKVLIKKNLGINNQDELLEREDVSYGCMADGSTQMAFRRSNNPTVKQMYAKMASKNPTVFVKSYSEGVNRVRNEEYAMIGDSTTLEYTTMRACELTSFPLNLFQTKGYALAFQKDSKYKSEFDAAILSLRESGDITMLYHKWWNVMNQCTNGFGGNQMSALSLCMGVIVATISAVRLF